MRQVFASVAAGVAFSFAAFGCVEMVDEAVLEVEAQDIARVEQAAGSVIGSYLSFDNIDSGNMMKVGAFSGGLPVGVLSDTPFRRIRTSTMADLSYTAGLSGLTHARVLLDQIVSTANRPTHMLTISDCDFNSKCSERRQLRDARAIEIALPTLETGSTAPLEFKAKLGGGSARILESDDESAFAGTPPRGTTAGAFVVQVDNVNVEGVTKVELPTVRRPLPSGNQNGALTLTNPKVTVTGAAVQTWLEWYQAMVIDQEQGAERAVTVVVRDHNGRDEFRVEMFDVGIIRYDEGVAAANGVRRATFELYVNGIRIRQ